MASVLARLRAVLAVLFNRPLPVKLKPNGVRAHYFPGEGVVLPSILGAEEPEETEEEKKAKEEAEQKEEEEEREAKEEEEKGGGGEETVESLKEQLKQERRESRKHERRSKTNHGKVKELEDKLSEKESEEQTEHQKALTKAKEEARNEALTEAEKERRSDRLEVAVTRAAGKKIKLGEGDDAKQVRFDDPEDAEIYLRRMIDKGDLDEDDLFDDNGKVKADAVTEALTEILEDKPRLAEDSGSDEGKGKKADGDADQGKGKGGGAAPSDMNALLRK